MRARQITEYPEDVVQVYLHVQTNNDSALDFYKAFGFEIVSVGPLGWMCRTSRNEHEHQHQHQHQQPTTYPPPHHPTHPTHPPQKTLPDRDDP